MYVFEKKLLFSRKMTKKLEINTNLLYNCSTGDTGSELKFPEKVVTIQTKEVMNPYSRRRNRDGRNQGINPHRGRWYH